MVKTFIVIFIISFILFYIQFAIRESHNKKNENYNKKLSDYNKYVKMEQINKIHESTMSEIDKMCKECTSRINELYDNAKLEIDNNYYE